MGPAMAKRRDLEGSAGKLTGVEVAVGSEGQMPSHRRVLVSETDA